MLVLSNQKDDFHHMMAFAFKTGLTFKTAMYLDKVTSVIELKRPKTQSSHKEI